MCSVYYKPEFLTAAFEQFDKAGVSILLHGGDLSEGMSDRPGHIYELTHLGYAAQKAYCVEQMKQWTKPMYLIDGNHDRWFIKKAGALIVADVCDSIPNATFLGHDEGDLKVNGITIKLFHGEDGASYATSYRVQKIIEAFSGGEKPNVLLLGHDHKEIVMFERNVHAVAGGCLSTQSKWMRSKRLAAYPGFHIIRMVIGKAGVASFTTTFFPFYA
jgi:predicted phosphodiesterase